jgi:nucleotide-binding universal stress UspA family protein
MFTKTSGGDTMYQRILVPLDGSATADRGLREAIALAADQQATLHLLHVLDDMTVLAEVASNLAFQDLMASLRRHGEELLARAGQDAAAAKVACVASTRETTGGQIAEAIVQEVRSAGCDLVVMGTHGRRGLGFGAMGSDALQVVRLCPVPVLLVRHDAPRLLAPD